MRYANVSFEVRVCVCGGGGGGVGSQEEQWGPHIVVRSSCKQGPFRRQMSLRNPHSAASLWSPPPPPISFLNRNIFNINTLFCFISCFFAALLSKEGPGRGGGVHALSSQESDNVRLFIVCIRGGG